MHAPPLLTKLTGKENVEVYLAVAKACLEQGAGTPPHWSAWPALVNAG